MSFDLNEAREEIDAIDEEIRELIGDRNDMVALIQAYKMQNNMPLWDQDRVDEIVESYIRDFGSVAGTDIATAIIGRRKEFER